MKPISQKKKIKLASMIISISLCLATIWFYQTRVKAQSEEASPTANEEVEEIREAVKEKVEAAKTGEKRALVGKLSEIFNNTLVLSTRQGERRAQVATDAAIISQGKEIEFEGLEIGSNLICMGYLRPDEILDTRRVVEEEEEKAPVERVVVFGQITNLDEDEEIISIKNPQNETTWEIEITSKTELTRKVEGEIEDADFDDLSLGDKIVAVGTQTADQNRIIASLVYDLASFTDELEETPTPTQPEETEE